MKTTIKILLSVLALGVMTSAPLLRAQDDAKAPPAGGQPGAGGGAGQRGGRGGGGAMLTIESIETAVGKLTDEQKTKITPILAKLQKDIAALAQADRRTKGPELRTAAMKDVRAVLTEDQAKKFDEMQAQGGRRGAKGGGGGGRKKAQ